MDLFDAIMKRMAPQSASTFYDADPNTFFGKSALGEDWTAVRLRTKTNASVDSFFYEFETPTLAPLRLATTAYVVSRLPNALNHERPYTPITGPSYTKGFGLLVKSYGTGLGAHMASLAVGDTLEFKHTPQMVTRQYPFTVDTLPSPNLVLVAGGTGITPMIQALHPVLGKPEDTRTVRLFSSSSSESGILAKGILDNWKKKHGRQLDVRYAVTRTFSESWLGHRGRMDRDYFTRMLKPRDIETSLVVVCGPVPMVSSLLQVFLDVGYPRNRVSACFR